MDETKEFAAYLNWSLRLKNDKFAVARTYRNMFAYSDKTYYFDTLEGALAFIAKCYSDAEIIRKLLLGLDA